VKSAILYSLFLGLIAQAWGLEISHKDFCLQYATGVGEKAVRTELLTRRIKVEEGVNPHLLGVLVGIFREYQFYGPLKIKLDASAGPKKAWVTGSADERTLWLARNAADLILGAEIEKITTQVCQGDPTKTHDVSLSWTNTVYEQVMRTLIPAASISKQFQAKSGWQLASPASDPDSTLEQPFRDEEIVTITKQFIDLPHEVLRGFDLKYLARARVGRNVDNAAGVYYVEKKKILLTDAAFYNSMQMYGEGTVLHEFGHSWWFSQNHYFHKLFNQISWQLNGDKWEKKESGIKGFVSLYASTKPEEDFAESFSAYIHQPEKLKDTSLEKFRFLRKHVFRDVTYFSTVAENAKVFVDSQTTDKKPPILTDLMRKCLKLRVLPMVDEKVKVTARLGCFWDLMSGPAEEMLFSVAHRKEDESRILVTLKPLPRVPGEDWVLEGEGNGNYKDLVKGEYWVPQLTLKDKAGNTDYVSGDAGPFVTIDGGMGTGRPSRPPIDWNQIQLKPIAPVNGHPGYEVELPIGHTENLASGHFNWFHKGTQEKTVHVMSFDRPDAETSKPGDAKIKGVIYFNKGHLAGDLLLSAFTLFYKGSPTTIPHDHEYVYSPRDPEIVHRATSTADLRGDVDVNRMTLSAVEGPNKEGGKWSIRMRIPLTSPKETEFSMTIWVRAPSGNRLLFSVYESGLARNGHRVYEEGGQTWLEGNLALKIHPERGDYIFESIEIENEMKRERSDPLGLDHLKFVRKIKLLERGIRKEFKITPSERLDVM
jgi:hypothetical protein